MRTWLPQVGYQATTQTTTVRVMYRYPSVHIESYSELPDNLTTVEKRKTGVQAGCTTASLRPLSGLERAAVASSQDQNPSRTNHSAGLTNKGSKIIDMFDNRIHRHHIKIVCGIVSIFKQPIVYDKAASCSVLCERGESSTPYFSTRLDILQENHPSYTPHRKSGYFSTAGH